MHLQIFTLASFLSTLIAASPAAVPIPLARQLSRPFTPSPIWLNARQPQDNAAPSVISSTSSNPSTLTISTTSTPLSSNALTTTISSPTATTSPMLAPEHRNHNVALAFNGTRFTPTTLKNISIGDTLTFYFYPKNYSIVQSSFDKPCVPRTGGVDLHPIFSGFDYDSTSGISLNKFVVNVTTTDSIWMYGYDGDQSNGGDVCQKGMAMVVNPLSKAAAEGQTLKTYVKNANAVKLDGIGQTVEKCPRKTYGGEKIRLSEKQKATWESRHPLSVKLNGSRVDDAGVDGNGSSIATASAGKANETEVAKFHNGAERGVGNRRLEKSLMAIVVLVGAGVFGLGL